MKKVLASILAIMLAFTIALSFAACKNKEEEDLEQIHRAASELKSEYEKQKDEYDKLKNDIDEYKDAYSRVNNAR